jgi:hypothetical protein
MQSPTVAVPIGPCSCPGEPHTEGDYVELRTKLGLAAGTMLQRLVVEANQNRGDNAAITGKLAEAYLLVGVAGWSFVDEAGPVPVNPMTIQDLLLDDFARSATLADKADDLYLGPVLLPLVNRAATSSPTTTTSASTSAKRGGSSKAQRRS